MVPCPISNSWYGMPVPATALVGESVQTQKVRVDLKRRADSSPVEERSVGKYRKHPTPEHKGIWNGNMTTCRFGLAACPRERSGRKGKVSSAKSPYGKNATQEREKVPVGRFATYMGELVKLEKAQACKALRFRFESEVCLHMVR